MIDIRNTSSESPAVTPSFTRTTVALLLLGSLLVGALAGAGASLFIARRLQPPQTISAASGGAANPAAAFDEVAPATVAITMRGVKPSTGTQAADPARGALGSGFVLDDEGHVLTTSDVAKVDRLQVVFADGRTAVATRVGKPDGATKLAVLKVSAPVPEPPSWGRVSRLRAGEPLISVGVTRQALGRTLDVGNVAALGYAAVLGGRQQTDNLILTDAAAPEGAAGGPVLNARGEVVGVMVLPAAQPGGWSLVLPMETARGVANRIIAGGSESRASLGIQPITITPEMAKVQRLSPKSGALVNAVFPGTPAVGKLRKGDIIISLEGKVLTETRTLDSVLAEYQPGRKVAVQFARNGIVSRVSLPLVSKPSPATLRGTVEPTP